MLSTKSAKRGKKRIDFNASYFAGYLDGEGCITISSGGSAYVCISNTYLPILKAIKKKYGGLLYRKNHPNPNARQQWRWQASGATAVSVVADVLPYLIEKREQAILLLEYRSLRSTAENRPRRDEIKSQIKALKRLEHLV